MKIEFDNIINLKFGSAIDLDSRFVIANWKRDPLLKMDVYLTVKGKARNERYNNFINVYDDREIAGYLDPIRHMVSTMSGNGIRHCVSIFLLRNERDEDVIHTMVQLANEYTPEHRYDETWTAKQCVFNHTPTPELYNSVMLPDNIEKEFGAYEEYMRITNSFVRFCRTMISQE